MLNKVLYALKLKKRPDVDRGKVLKAFPLRNQLITWEMDDKGEASLVIPQKEKAVGKTNKQNLYATR